jgi:hypothetical protein
MTFLQPPPREAVEDLLHRDHYTPEQIASLLGISPELIVHEVHEHRLDAYIIDHRIIDIRRDEIMRWLDTRS